MKVVTIGSLALAAALAFHGSASATLCGFPGLPDCTDAPEIDPNMLRGAIAVLAGGVMMLAGRRRR